jgi:CubicO group peptidase (beta-lactamase class C family)
MITSPRHSRFLPEKTLQAILLILIILLTSCSGKRNENKDDIRNCIELKFLSKSEEASIRKKINAEHKAFSIDTIFQKKSRVQGFNGAVLVAQHGVIIYRNAFGYTTPDRKELLTANHIFQLASVSKTFTSVAILILADRKQLALNDSVQVYLPDFPYHGILIKDLMSHRSGLPNYLYSFEEKRKQGTAFPSNDSILKWFRQASPLPTLYNRPDVAFSYNNTNFILLASIVEKVSGQTFAVFLKSEIFDPLGMKHTFLDTICSDSLSVIKTTGYDRNRKRVRDFYDGVYGDKGIYSTVDDMFRWYMALNSNCLVSKHLLKEAFTPRSKERKSRHNYGYGFRLMTDADNMNEVRYVYHGGWWAGYSSMFTFNLKEDYVIIVLSNRKNASVYENKAIMEILDNKPITGNGEEIDSL